jgi:hypothetical protein
MSDPILLNAISELEKLLDHVKALEVKAGADEPENLSKEDAKLVCHYNIVCPTNGL